MNEAEKRGYKKVRITRDVGGWPVGSIAWYEDCGAAWDEDCKKAWSHTLGDNCEYVTDELKLEVGKYYRTRDGRKAEVIEDDGSAPNECFYVDHGNGLELWHFPDGRNNIHSRNDDLIAEWHDEPAASTPAITGHYVLKPKTICAVQITKQGKVWMRHTSDPAKLTQAIATLTTIRDHLIANT